MEWKNWLHSGGFEKKRGEENNWWNQQGRWNEWRVRFKVGLLVS